MNVISLASGTGLLDYGLKYAGHKILFQCEYEPVQLAILEKLFPESIKHPNIFRVDKAVFENNNINTEECLLLGGLCCQPFSRAGAQKGEDKDTYMVEQFAKIVEQTRPKYILQENVEGFLDLESGYTRLVNLLEELGYHGSSILFPASALGSPQQRYRIFLFFARDKKYVIHTNDFPIDDPRTNLSENIIEFDQSNSHKIKPFYKIETMDFEKNYDHNSMEPFNPRIKKYKIAKEGSAYKRIMNLDSKLLQIYGNAVELESSVLLGEILNKIEACEKSENLNKLQKIVTEADEKRKIYEENSSEEWREMHEDYYVYKTIMTVPEYFIQLIRHNISAYKEYEQLWVHTTQEIVPKNERTWPEEKQHKIISLRRRKKRRLNAVRNHEGTIPRNVQQTPTASMGTLGRLKIRKEILKDDATFYVRNGIEEIWNNPMHAAWLQNVPKKMYEDIKAVVEKFY